MEIGNKRIELSPDQIQIDSSVILIKDIFDFDFTHSYFNGQGGAELILKTPSKEFKIKQDDSWFNLSFGKKDRLNSLLNLYHTLLPTLITNFIKTSLDRISKGQEIEIAKIKFNRTGIIFSPRTTYWLKTYKISYKDAGIASEQRNLGLTGASGSAGFLFVYDHSKGETYRYSSAANHQPSQAEQLKAEKLLTFIQRMENKTFLQ